MMLVRPGNVRLRTRKAQFIALVSFVLLLGAATMLSYWQPVPPQFTPEPTVGSWRWWLKPIEQNVALRPPVTAANLNSVFFSTPQSGWAVGEGGTIMHTEDGGETWAKQTSTTSSDLNSVLFATSESGWAAGDNGTILHTENRGQTWTKQNSVTGAPLQSIVFVTSQSGWAVGPPTKILHTEDGGQTWKAQTTNTVATLQSAAFIAPDSGWVVGQAGTILHTEDGGQSWRSQISHSGNFLQSVAFATPQLGWAVGFPGRILHTQDGGGTWTEQSRGISENLFSVAFVTPQSGWAAGSNGNILHTDDGGQSWVPQMSGTDRSLRSLAFKGARLGWAVGLDGTVVHTENGGQSWRMQAGNRPLFSVAFATPQFGWAVGADGTILHTEDAGQSWTVQASGTSKSLDSVSFTSPQSGWAVGEGGTILHTENGGRSWGAQVSGTGEWLVSVVFSNPQSGWILQAVEGNEEGVTILHTENGGQDWHKQILPLLNVFDVAFPTPKLGLAVGDHGKILLSEDGGHKWEIKEHVNDDWRFHSLSFPTPRSGWAVGDEGKILHTNDGGQSWKTQTSGTDENLLYVAFATSRSGWILGEEGNILQTDDGGENWKTQTTITDSPVNSLVFVTSQSGWALSNDGAIVHTDDGGKTWSRLGYRRWPAPWFALVILCCIVGLSWASLPLVLEAHPYIEDLANADSPVAQLRYDVLGFKTLVTRLLRFIQNPKTKPPLALAIQAPWGMGKSSVMSMLQTELKEKRAAVTVWFNAWHHQKEDQLLAYLLEAIQKQVVPSWFSPVGLGFRFNLLRVRMFTSPERFLATAGALALLVLHQPLASFLSRFNSVPEYLRSHYTWPIVVVASLLLSNQLRAFSSDPQKLIDQSTHSLWRTLRDLVVFPSLQGKTDVRQEFANSLREVTDALLPQRLVIFLDDLDRCPPDHVVQILEAINFLSSAAPCFVIVGAEYRKIETLAGQQFETIAIQEAENIGRADTNQGSNQSQTVAARLDYARNYMRKIINMRLDLPEPTPKGYADLIRQVGEPRSRTGTLWQRATVGLILLFCIVASMAISAKWIELPFGKSGQTQEAISKSNLVPAAQPENTVPVSPSPSGGTTAQPVSRAESRTTLSEPDRDAVGVQWGHRLTIAVPVLITLIFIVLLLRRPKELEKAVDSQPFSDALDRMAPNIQGKCKTPREVRRFQNYLRFLAAWDDTAARPHVKRLEAYLVELAATGIIKDGKERTDISPEVIQFFVQQCQMLGLDANTFRPAEERDGPEHSAAVSA